jgi:tetratricopeptide (TPR) repeat protein
MHTVDQDEEGSSRAALPLIPPIHLAYVEELSAIGESDPRWPAVMAGFLVLRFTSKWADAVARPAGVAGGSVQAPWLREVHGIHEAIAAVQSGATRRMLENLYGAVLAAWGERTARRDIRVSTTLLAYGHHLQQDGAWALSANVFETFIGYAESDEEYELVPDAYIRLAHALRMAGRIDDAAAAYDAGGALATAEGNVRAALLSRLGAARVLRHRGNLPGAAAAVESVIADATELVTHRPSAALRDALGRAKHDLGVICYERDDDERSAVLLYEALQLVEDERQRERVLADLSTNLADLGFLDASRDGNLVLYATAREQGVRQNAGCNLMSLAVSEGQETVFEHYRRALGAESMSPETTVYYQVLAGEGFRRFGRIAAARSVLLQAVELAEQNHLNVWLMRADAALAALDLPPVPHAEPVEETSTDDAAPAVQFVAQAVRRLREQSLVGANA